MSSTDRPIDHVAPEEIANAMAALCRASAGMRREELLTQTAAVFGYKRRTPTTTPALEAALNVGAAPRPAHRAAVGPADRLSTEGRRAVDRPLGPCLAADRERAPSPGSSPW